MTTPVYQLKQTCPFCGKENDLATNVGGAREPKNGDISFCIGCGEFAIFDIAMTGSMRKPNAKEYESIVANKQTASLRGAWLEAKRKREEPAKEEPPPVLPDHLEKAFISLMENVYNRAGFKPRVLDEFRRLFFSGALTALGLLVEAHNDDDSDVIVMGTLFDELVDEGNRFCRELKQKA